MKKLLIVCGILLGAGVCMMLGGWAAGGMLYGAYYNGALHPVRETISDSISYVRDRLRVRSWQDEDGVWHHRWFVTDDELYDDAPIEDALDDAADRVEDALGNAADRVDDALDRAEDALDRAEDALDRVPDGYDDDYYDDYDDYYDNSYTYGHNGGGNGYHHAEQNRHGW